MKLKTLIVEDHPKEYEKMKAILKDFDFIEVIGKYFGDSPYEEALNYIDIEKPPILIFDYDLGQGSTKTGKELFKAVNNYKCFVIFYSRVYEATNSQSAFMNAKFIKKEIDPLVSIEDLKQVLELAKQYLIEDKKVKLKYYKNGISDGSTDNILIEEIYCKDLVQIIGREKKYGYVYFNGVKFIERSGPASKGTGAIIEPILNLGVPDLILHSKSPFTLYNKGYFDQNPKSKEFSLKDSFKSNNRYKFT